MKKVAQDSYVIILHIPKTAGSTLWRIVQRQYGRKDTYQIRTLDEFLKLPEARRQAIKAFRGHIHFGIHEFLPGPSTYITVLRDPVERIISHYYYVLRTPHDKHYRKIHKMSLEEYVSSGVITELDNNQTRRLAGPESLNIGFGQCLTETLEMAKQNLREYFAVVGLSERFDETVLLLRRTFGWKSPLYIKMNVTANRPRKEDISKETLRIIEKHNELDIELYSYVEKLLNETIRQQQNSFATELKVFQVLNSTCSKVYPFYRTVRGIMLL